MGESRKQKPTIYYASKLKKKNCSNAIDMLGMALYQSTRTEMIQPGILMDSQYIK